MRERAGEYLMMRLRTVSGISAEDYERMFLLSFEPIAEQLERNRQLGYVARTEDNRWHLTPKGFLISNTIISDLLVAQDKSIPLKRL